MKNKAGVVIIGGGISGCSIAYNLAKKGFTDVVVIERNYLGSGSTGRCGAGVRQQWGTEMNCKIAKASIEFFQTAKEELNYHRDIEFKQEGYLLLATNEEEDKRFSEDVRLQNSLGIPSIKVTKEEAREIVPHLNTEEIVSATFCKTDGHLNPFLLLDAYYQAALKLGVTFMKYTTVTDIKTVGNKIVSVVTNKGEIETDKVVNAAGGYAKEIGTMVGVDIPVISRNHEILVTEPIEKIQGPMVMSFSKNIYCQQTPHGSFIMGRGDERSPGYSMTSTWKFLDEMSKTVTKLLPLIGNLRVIRQWGGLYNISPDHQPIYGEVKEIKGFYLAVGFSGHGFMFGPMTGLLVAEQILGLPNTIDVSSLSIERFSDSNLIHEKLVV